MSFILATLWLPKSMSDARRTGCGQMMEGLKDLSKAAPEVPKSPQGPPKRHPRLQNQVFILRGFSVPVIIRVVFGRFR